MSLQQNSKYLNLRLKKVNAIFFDSQIVSLQSPKSSGVSKIYNRFISNTYTTI